VKPGRGLLPVGVIRVQPLPRLGVITKFAEEPRLDGEVGATATTEGLADRCESTRG
jgi:hypothetical protein